MNRRKARQMINDVRVRVARRTFVPDVTEAQTGRVDRLKVAAKFNNLEHAVDDLANVVEQVMDEAESA